MTRFRLSQEVCMLAARYPPGSQGPQEGVVNSSRPLKVIAHVFAGDFQESGVEGDLCRRIDLVLALSQQNPP